MTEARSAPDAARRLAFRRNAVYITGTGLGRTQVSRRTGTPKGKKDMKTIMVLGGGIYQLPLILKAREMGLRVIVVTYRGNYPGIPLADIFLDIDTTDCEAVFREAEKYKIDAIVTTGTDVCLPTLGYVAEKLHLKGPSYEVACRCKDKVLMKEAFEKYGVATARHRAFTEFAPAEAFAAEIGFPVMVKAPDSSGSRGVTKASSPGEFKEAWDEAANVSRTGKIIVEKFLDGIEFGADSLIGEGDDITVFIHGKVVSPPPCSAPVGHSMPTMLSPEIQEKTRSLIRQAVRALGLKNCVANCDLMLVGDTPYILELGARMGATCIPEIISTYAGQNVYGYLIDLALGNPCKFTVGDRQPNAALLLRSPRTGVVEELFVPDEVKNHPGLIELHWDCKVGDKVQAFKVGPDRIGHILVKGNSAAEAAALAEDLYSKIQVRVKNEA